jgi:uncharacterized protein (TIGR03435 family)
VEKRYRGLVDRFQTVRRNSLLQRYLALAIVLVAVSPLGSDIRAQSLSTHRPEFEVASIRRSEPGARPGGTFIPPGGERYTASNAYLKFLIQEAYHLQRDQITGGPSWISTDLYNLNAKAEQPCSIDTMHLMLQSLLADRFKLKFHFETVEGPYYSLVVDNGGPRLVRHDAEYGHEPFNWGARPPGQDLKIAWHATSASMDYLAWQIASVIYMPVMNSTGLKAITISTSRSPWSGLSECPKEPVPAVRQSIRRVRRCTSLFASWGSN